MNGPCDDFPGLPLSTFPSLVEYPFRQAGGLAADLTLDFSEELTLCLLYSEAGDPLQGLSEFPPGLFAGGFVRRQGLLPPPERVFGLLRLALPLLDQALFSLKTLFPLGKAPLKRVEFRSDPLLLLLELAPGLQEQIFGFELRFLDQVLRFPARDSLGLGRVCFGMAQLGPQALPSDHSTESQANQDSQDSHHHICQNGC